MAPTSPITPNRARMSVARRYQETNHLIPTPSEFQKSQRYNPIALWLPVVVGTPLMMLGLAIALEVGVGISQKNAGFAVPVKNLIPQASQQFLLSFFPTVFVIPVAFLWRELDYFLRWYQPYVLLSKGNVKAEESLLMDYVSAGPFWSILYGFRFKHWLVFFSAYTAVFTYLLQPLAGSIFQIQQRDKPIVSTVNITTAIGLNDATIADNTAFVASAGFVQTAVFNGLNDPPFIQGGWTTTEFDFPTYEGFNGSMSVNTTGIKSIVNCTNPTARPAITQDNNQTIITATSVDGCSVKVNLTTESSTQQYGVVDTGGCSGIGDVQKRPVMFWFFHDKDDGTQEARTVFCAPTLQASIVEASANLANGNMTSVHATAPFETGNNVTGAPLNGQAFNGVVFNNSQNPFIQARASATNNGVPGAIFRLASQDKSGLQSVFDDDNGFLNKTIPVYTQHLALSAKGIYFVPIVQTILPSRQISSVPRLVINPIAAHTLAFFMLIIGAAGLFVQILFRRKRNTLLLAAPPGSIAAVTALTAHSGFGQLLFPYDNMETLGKKLEGFRFRMDQRTGAIIVDDSMDEESTTTDRGVRQSLLPPSEKLTPGQTPMEMTSTTSLLPETSYFGGRVPTEYQPTPLITPSNES